MTEVFAWEHWKKVRYYAGIKVGVSKLSTLDFFYMYNTFAGKVAAEHNLGFGYILSL